MPKFPQVQVSIRVLCTFVLVYLVVAHPCSLFAQDPEGMQQAPANQAFTLKSPYRSLAKTRQLLDVLTNQIALYLDYEELDGKTGSWKISDLSGVESARYYTKSPASGLKRTIEMAILSRPQGGYDLACYGQETSGGGARQPNPDLTYLQSFAETQIAGIETELLATKPQDRGHELYQFSYVQSDRAIGLLKSLGYTAIEYSQSQGENAYERIYTGTNYQTWVLPAIVKLIDSPKTSLMEPPPAGGFQQQQSSQYSAVPDIGGTFLHGQTSGEPQQRVLIVYDKNDPESLEKLLSLLRDKIDLPSRQIVIEALVIEINTDKVKDLGIQVGGGKDRYGASFEQFAGQQPFSFVFGQNSRFDPFGNPLNAFGDYFSFRSTIRALIETNDAEILSSPSVLVLDGRQARIQVGQQVPVVKSTSTGNSIIQSVDYFPVGIVLNLRPRISADGSEVTMQVETIVSAVNQSASAQAGDVFFAPTVDNRQVQTFVRVADNTPFIIGGLISTDFQEKRVGIPILSQIPILGLPFRRKVIDKSKKEVIVVLTPHVVPLEEKSFSYVIPKDSKIFDAFGNQLFRNAYRVRDDDIFDLRFLYESEIFKHLMTRLKNWASEDLSIKNEESYANLLSGRVPGEEIMVRRMLWEIVHKTGYGKNVSPNRMILLEDRPSAPDSSGFQIAFLHNLQDKEDHKTLVLSFDAQQKGTPEHPFVPPKAKISYQSAYTSPEGYISDLMRGNKRRPEGSPEKWTVLLSDIKPRGVRGATALEVLQGVMVLKRILALNSTLPLSIKEFRVGRQIIFPTEQDLQQRFHIIDRDAAQFFYEVVQYYTEFEKTFSRETQRINGLMQERGVAR
jgi:hypothetical protein